MVRYHNFDIVFAEIPDETTLAINITNCPNRCPAATAPICSATGARGSMRRRCRGCSTATGAR